MRIFATGAMNWVMSRSLDDTVPIESKMVTKSVERAQTTVEQRNAETRKNVLRYDEVMNNQRRVIYKLRRPDPGGGGDCATRHWSTCSPRSRRSPPICLPRASRGTTAASSWPPAACGRPT